MTNRTGLGTGTAWEAFAGGFSPLPFSATTTTALLPTSPGPLDWRLFPCQLLLALCLLPTLGNLPPALPTTPPCLSLGSVPAMLYYPTCLAFPALPAPCAPACHAICPPPPPALPGTPPANTPTCPTLPVLFSLPAFYQEGRDREGYLPISLPSPASLSAIT